MCLLLLLCFDPLQAAVHDASVEGKWQQVGDRAFILRISFFILFCSNTTAHEASVEGEKHQVVFSWDVAGGGGMVL